MFGSEYPNTEISCPKFFLNNYCGYFIKELPNGFPCLDNVIQTFGMLLDFRKAKNTRLAACVFLRFSTVSQHPACLNHVIQTRKTIRYFFKPSSHISAMVGDDMRMIAGNKLFCFLRFDRRYNS